MNELQHLRKALLQWYDESKRDLPWRSTRDPYRIWISEVMLQQTQVKTVVPYYWRFLERFPSIHDLAAADQEEVLKCWEGLGYYARARNLHRAARHIVQQMGGKIPRSYETLQRIPGIGSYTAAAIASIAFGAAIPVLDGNVKRVLSRIFRVESEVTTSATLNKLQTLAETLLDETRPGDFNQALMELGATLCLPRKPACLLCPLGNFCRARKELDDPSRLPVRRKKKPVPHYRVAVGLIWDDGHLFIDRRKEDGLLGGLWEFPGGKIQRGETPQAAVKREIKEELDLDVEVGDYFMEVQHAYSHFKVSMVVYHCIFKGGEPRLTAATDWRWVKPEELRFFPFAAASHKIIRKLEQEFSPAIVRKTTP